jgi:DNA-binding transcriptional ArsR family regulator
MDDGTPAPLRAAALKARPSADVQAGSTVVGQRLAKALTHPLRIKILVELNKRAMSPTQFTNEFYSFLVEQKGSSGASRSAGETHRALCRYVARHFRRLEELKCIELVEIKTGGRRRGGKEHVFRAIQRVLFDASSWLAVPDSHRERVTAAAFTTYFDQVAQAMQAGTVDARGDRHFTWTALHYDEQGWKEMAADIDALFVRSLELRVEAALRMAKSQERSIPVTVAFACFESPESTNAPDSIDVRVRRKPPSISSADSKSVSHRLARALAHPLRIKILVELNKRAMSPTQFAWEIGGASLSNVSRHFRRLEELKCIELVEIKTGGRRRGGKEHFFRATQRSLFDESIWTSLPNSIRSQITASTFTTYIERAAEAIRTGTMDARDDRHFTWTAMHYDLEAWNCLIQLMDALFRRSLEIQDKSQQRVLKSKERLVPVTVALTCFESPPEAHQTPVPRLERFRLAMSDPPGSPQFEIEPPLDSSLPFKPKHLRP